MNNVEIERKFLPTRVPYQLDQLESHYIEQGYLNTAPVVRVRRKDDKYILTCKGQGMMERVEYEMLLDEASYNNLIKKADGNIITKRRHIIPLEDGLIGELDVFEGALKGLIMLEVEFDSREAAESFIIPDWFGKEVTTDPRFHNSNMSKSDYKIPKL